MNSGAAPAPVRVVRSLRLNTRCAPGTSDGWRSVPLMLSWVMAHQRASVFSASMRTELDVP
jgi:hypothetical protein